MFARLQEHMIMRLGHPVPNALEMLKPWKKHYFHMFTTNSWNGEVVERISKKRMKNKAKTTKPDMEWKSVEKTKSSQSPNLKKSTTTNPEVKK
ncbi:hypothetical protein Tco_1093614 [Tanacetum coccineum]|uniref:Uncharacterized protein n=1 Tax=Tanacetum coccineum TaxID=301880 RepID=A0ABQ5IEE5_9ASTR